MEGHDIYIPELERLARSCNAFTEGLEAARNGFARATEELAASWRDAHYGVLVARVEPILAECTKALAVARETLGPFIQKKLDWAKSAPGL